MMHTVFQLLACLQVVLMSITLLAGSRLESVLSHGLAGLIFAVLSLRVEKEKKS